MNTASLTSRKVWPLDSVIVSRKLWPLDSVIVRFAVLVVARVFAMRAEYLAAGSVFGVVLEMVKIVRRIWVMYLRILVAIYVVATADKNKRMRP